MTPDNFNTVLISMVTALVGSLLTWLGVRRKSTADEAAAFLRTGMDMQALVLEAKNQIQEGLEQQIGRAENARISAEKARDQTQSHNSELMARISDLELKHAEQSRIAEEYRRGYKKVVTVLMGLIGREGLEELSDLPEDF